MSHSVSTTDGKVPPEEAARLVALHGSARAAEIIAEVEGRFAAPEQTIAADPPSPKQFRRGKPPADIPTSENQE